jgi:hypothetical protein
MHLVSISTPKYFREKTKTREMKKQYQQCKSIGQRLEHVVVRAKRESIESGQRGQRIGAERAGGRTSGPVQRVATEGGEASGDGTRVAAPHQRHAPLATRRPAPHPLVDHCPADPARLLHLPRQRHQPIADHRAPLALLARHHYQRRAIGFVVPRAINQMWPRRSLLFQRNLQRTLVIITTAHT